MKAIILLIPNIWKTRLESEMIWVNVSDMTPPLNVHLELKGADDVIMKRYLTTADDYSATAKVWAFDLSKYPNLPSSRHISSHKTQEPTGLLKAWEIYSKSLRRSIGVFDTRDAMCIAADLMVINGNYMTYDLVLGSCWAVEVDGRIHVVRYDSKITNMQTLARFVPSPIRPRRGIMRSFQAEGSKA